MCRFLLLFIALFLGGVVYAQPSEALRNLLADSTLRWASVGVDVRQVDGGRQIIEHNSHVALIPASVTKLISTAFALDICGPNFTLETQVYREGDVYNGYLNGTLLIHCSGDPTLDSRYFPEKRFLNSIITSLKEQGINSVAEIKIVPTISISGRYSGAWLSEDVANYYGASWMPFNWLDNSCDIVLRSDMGNGYFVSEEPNGYICNYNCMLNIERGVKPDVWVYGGANGYREIRGVMPPNVTTYSVRASMGFPEEYFKAQFDRLTNRPNVIETGLSNGNRILVASYLSPTFSEIISVANRRSINLYVEAVANIAASKVSGSESYCDKMKMWLEKVASDYQGVVLKDGCGLAPLNRVPISVFTDLLLWSNGKWGGAFDNSLAVAGQVGTLKNFANNYPNLNGKVIAKSGSMSGVRALAGYITAKSGKQYAFTIIANGFTVSGTDVMGTFAKFLNKLYQEL